jgi:hypothetical protein
MTISAFKIKCKIVEITQLSKKGLIRKIPLILKEDEYNITNTSNSEIEFEPINDSFSRLRGISSQRIYQGTLVIIENGKDVQLELVYFISYKFFLLAIIISLIMGIFSDPIDFVLGVFALVFFLIDILKQRHIARRLVLELINSAGNTDIDNID